MFPDKANLVYMMDDATSREAVVKAKSSLSNLKHQQVGFILLVYVFLNCELITNTTSKVNINKSELTGLCMMNRTGFPSNTDNKDDYLQQEVQYVHYEGLCFFLPFGGTWQGWTGTLSSFCCQETQSDDQRSCLWWLFCLEDWDESAPAAPHSALDSGVVGPQAIWKRHKKGKVYWCWKGNKITCQFYKSFTWAKNESYRFELWIELKQFSDRQ